MKYNNELHQDELIKKVYLELLNKQRPFTARNVSRRIYSKYKIIISSVVVGIYFHKNNIKRKHTRFGNVVCSTGEINIKSNIKKRKQTKYKKVCRVVSKESYIGLLLNNGVNPQYSITNKKGDVKYTVRDNLSRIVLQIFDEFGIQYDFIPTNGYRSISNLNGIPLKTKAIKDSTNSCKFIDITIWASTIQALDVRAEKLEQVLDTYGISDREYTWMCSK